MKPIFFSFAASLFLLTLIIGCSKNNNSNPSSGTMAASVSGTVFTAATTVGAYSQSFGLIDVVGYTIKSNDTTIVTIGIPYGAPINHLFSSDSTLAGITYQITGKEYDAYLGFPGTKALITLTASDTVNHTITGTFSGTLYNDLSATDSVVVTNGTFTSSYTVGP